MSETNTIKVLIADDSLVSRNLLIWLIEREPGMKVVGIARNGEEALRQAIALKPDVISMDVEMPVMNGIEATRMIMGKAPLPVVIATTRYKAGETMLAMEVLAAGAVAIVGKPSGPGHVDHERQAKQYLRTLRAMAGVKVVRRRSTSKDPTIIDQDILRHDVIQEKKPKYRVLVIGASAGGPEGVQTLLKHLPENFPLPVAIVQHIDIRFAEGFGHWLANTTGKQVELVTSTVPLRPSKIYLTSLAQHLEILDKDHIGVTNGPAQGGHKPAVARLFDSARRVFGKEVIAVLLSGMGHDGAAELKSLRLAGAYTIIQDEQSCLVFGMPGEAAKLGAHRIALPPMAIVKHISQLLNDNNL